MRMRVNCSNALKDPDEDVRAEATTLMGKLNESEWATPLPVSYTHLTLPTSTHV